MIVCAELILNLATVDGLFMKQPGLFGSAELKLARAKKHLAELNGEVGAFLGRNPYQLVCDEGEHAIKKYCIKVIEDIPSQWSAIIGDVIHNARASLDNMATSLVRHAGHTSKSALNEAKFPIRSDAAAFSRDNKVLRLIGQDAEKIVRFIEPYQGGKGHELWALHNLDIVDKHRAIIPVGATFASIRINSSQPPASMPREHFPLKDGDEVFRSAFFEEHFHSHPEIAFYIALHEPPYATRQPIDVALNGFIEFCEIILEQFKRVSTGQ